mgnify:FL=1
MHMYKLIYTYINSYQEGGIDEVSGFTINTFPSVVEEEVEDVVEAKALGTEAEAIAHHGPQHAFCPPAKLRHSPLYGHVEEREQRHELPDQWREDELDRVLDQRVHRVRLLHRA